MKENLSKSGLKCAVEIHQRLDTKKLFCLCDSSQKEDDVSSVKRKLRPVAGEMGDIDPAAMQQFMRGKSFVYKIAQRESCLVELDEEPPHEINKEALQLVLSVCKLLDCEIPEEIHVMRKTIIDGSNTSGFQRTAVIGINGNVKVNGENIEIQQISLEEESARIESRTDNETIYKLSGLGIPLIEITTGIVDDPEKLQNLAEYLGMLLRSFRVQRGIGTIRQDVNVSIAGGSRIEIKGFQDLAMMKDLVINEMKRQHDLLKIREKLQKRQAEVTGGVIDITKYFDGTENTLVRNILNNNGKMFGMILRNFAGMFREECGNRTLGKEIAGYCQAYGLGGLIHTDEDLVKYKLRKEFDELRKVMKAKDRDLIAILAGKMPDVKNAAEAVHKRAQQLLSGIPEETRFADGIGSKFARPLPGKSRMYPETDVPPVISKQFMPEKLPKTIFEKEKFLKKQLPGELAEQMIRSVLLNTYEKLSAKYDPVLVASTLLSTMKDLRRQGHEMDKITEGSLDKIFSYVKKGEMPKNAIPEVMIELSQGKSWQDVENKFRSLPEGEVRRIVREILRGNSQSNEGTIMGLAMNVLRGKAEGKLVARIVKEEMK